MYIYSRLLLFRLPEVRPLAIPVTGQCWLSQTRLETTPLSLGKETGQVTINDSSQRNAWNVECVGDI